MTHHLIDQPPRLLWTVRDAARLLSIGETRMRELIRERGLLVVRLDQSGTMRLRHADLLRLVDELAAEAERPILPLQRPRKRERA